MTTHMTLASVAALFAALAVLAAVPGVSTLTVAARAAALGFRHGAATALGIVVADLLFMLAAIYGLALLAANLGGLFLWVKMAGGGYLIWTGITLLRAGTHARSPAAAAEDSAGASFMTGLLITPGDHKAILFYLGFFPAFMDLKALTTTDTALILLVAIVAVGGVKLAYAWMADWARALVSARVQRVVSSVAGGAMLVVGIVVIWRA